MINQTQVISKTSKVFEDAFSRLNPIQKEAVETIEGPVLVLAGPGTGKTQILAARIAFILQQTDTEPDNILCLTYTEAGTIAMRNRLFEFIGPAAYRVTISTFHEFCNDVIQTNLEIFGIRSLDAISELEEIHLYRELIDSFPNKHPLKRWMGDPYFEARRMKKLYSIMKTEDWTPEYICNKVDQYVESLAGREEYLYKRANSKQGYKKGDINERKLKTEKDKMDLLKAASKEFITYRKMMLDRKRYDFDDMIIWVINAFKEHPDLLLNYQEKYQYFLVDEFQDTNGTQNEILEFLINYWDKPNVFVVGDDDQSIFRFQGANVTNILTFYQSYRKNMKVFVIKENYRSSQNILDISKRLIQNNHERLIKVLPDLDKDLTANNPYADSPVKPEIRRYYSAMHETVHVAKEIEALKEADINLRDIAVIYRNHRQVDDLAKYLESKGIAVNIKRRSNVLDSPFIKKIVNILEYLNGEARHPHSREDLLFEILHFDFFDIEPLTIARLAMELKSKRVDRKQVPWREEIKAAGNKIKHELFGSDDNENYLNIKRLSDDLEYWIKAVHNTTVQVLVEKIVTRGGVLAYLMRSSEKVWLMQELSTFFEFIKDESIKNPRMDLSALIHTINLMRENKLSLPINKIAYSDSGVNLITAHSSKGLEFEYVFLIGCNKNIWEKGSRTSTYAFPDNILTHVDDGGDELEESRRLFYVALTRAKHHLYVSYPAADNQLKELEKSRFVAEILADGTLEEKEIHVADDFLIEYNFQLMSDVDNPEIELLEKAYIKKILEKYSLSVTHLNTYLKCPLSFYFKYILRVPTAKNQFMTFGSAVHYALEQLFRNMVKDPKNRFAPESELVGDFEWYMKRHRDSFTDDQFIRRMDYGKEILPLYYHHYIHTWNKVVSVERNIMGVEYDGVQLNGKLDKIEFDGKNANVVDYKTGQYIKSKKRFSPPVDDSAKEMKFEEEFGGDYWRQAVFYKILVDKDSSRDWDVASTEFDFIQPDENTGLFHKHKIEINDSDLQIVGDQIKDTYNKIMSLEFDRGCGDEQCKWCSFVRSHYRELKEEEEVEV